MTFALSVLWLAACAASLPPSQTTSKPTTDGRVSAPEEERLPCDAHFRTTGDLMADLTSLTRMCSLPYREQEVSPTRDGRQGEGDAVDRYAFTAEAGRCYRVYVVGDSDISDLDVQVIGPDGRPIVADTAHGAYAVVPSLAPLCVRQDGSYVVEAAVARGRGRYVVQVWKRSSDARALSSSPHAP